MARIHGVVIQVSIKAPGPGRWGLEVVTRQIEAEVEEPREKGATRGGQAVGRSIRSRTAWATRGPRPISRLPVKEIHQVGGF